jgi:hypothetical protein
MMEKKLSEKQEKLENKFIIYIYEKKGKKTLFTTKEKSS